MKFRALGLLIALAAAGQVQRSVDYQAVAVDAAKWIHSSRLETPFGYTWAADPRDPKTAGVALYNGSPGVVLFLLELNQATGERAYLDDARRGADELMTKVNTIDQMGLYDGIAGIGFAVGETWRATKDERYHRGILNVVRLLKKNAGAVGKGVQWSNRPDILSGSAGIGLFLLYADDLLHDTDSRTLAIGAGARLLDLGIADKAGLKWTDATFTHVVPNFGRGDAGIGYFLAMLYAKTKDKRFLDGAVAAATYLTSIAKTDGDVFLLPYERPAPRASSISSTRRRATKRGWVW
jgi:lantibiotic modifying enzyme